MKSILRYKLIFLEPLIIYKALSYVHTCVEIYTPVHACTHTHVYNCTLHHILKETMQGTNLSILVPELKTYVLLLQNSCTELVEIQLYRILSCLLHGQTFPHSPCSVGFNLNSRTHHSKTCTSQSQPVFLASLFQVLTLSSTSTHTRHLFIPL